MTSAPRSSWLTPSSEPIVAAPRRKAKPKPYAQRVAKTIFLPVPSMDWAVVKQGHKREFRVPEGASGSQKWNMVCPVPIVLYKKVANGATPDDCMAVLDATWREPLGAISAESIANEGFESMGHFRRYWMDRTKRRFEPLATVVVFQVRPFTSDDIMPSALGLLHRLYGEFMSNGHLSTI